MPVVPPSDGPPDLGSLSVALTGALTAGEVLDVLADSGRPLLAAESINISLLDGSGDYLRLVVSRRASVEVLLRFASYPVEADLPTREVVQGQVPVFIRSRADRDRRYPALKDLEVEQQSWAVYPLVAAGRLLGVVGLGWSTEQGFDPGQRALYAEVAELCAAALSRAQRYEQEHEARAAAERVAGRLSKLQTLTTQLARATDPATVAELVCHAGLRALAADAATIGTFDGADTMTALAAVGLPAERIARWSTLRLEDSALAREVLTTGQPVLLTSRAERDARYPDMAANSPDFATWATLPLIADEQPLGLVAFGWKPSREFSTDDVDYLGAIAAHAAIALDRSRLLASSRQVAETLQRALLPSVITTLPGWDLATCYLPAVQGTQVGGDWYDAFRTPDGRIALVLGDVTGKGVHAAAVMGSVRSAIRAHAIQDPTPGTVLHRLDQYFEAFKPDELVTCCFAVLDPGTGHLVYACAGQLPPLLLGAGGGARWLDRATTPPLGTGSRRRVQAEITIDPGEVLLVYSDGLVERRDADPYRCLDDLAAAAEALVTAGDLQPAAEALIRSLDGPSRVVDDLATIALRRHPEPVDGGH
jgi:serine phosphatase RsbU (regulator of sigma subunit)